MYLWCLGTPLQIRTSDCQPWTSGTLKVSRLRFIPPTWKWHAYRKRDVCLRVSPGGCWNMLYIVLFFLHMVSSIPRFLPIPSCRGTRAHRRHSDWNEKPRYFQSPKFWMNGEARKKNLHGTYSNKNIQVKAIHGYTHKATHQGVLSKQTPARKIGQRNH